MHSFSVDQLLYFTVDFVTSRLKRHVHEFALSVHLETTKNGGLNLVLNGEFFATVFRVGLESIQNLLLLVGIQFFGRDNGDLLLFVKFLIQLFVLLSDLVDVDKSLVLSEYLKEPEGNTVERSSLGQSIVKLLDFLGANTLVLSELSERFGVLVDLRKILHILVHVVESLILRSSGEEHVRVATLNGVFHGRRHVTRSRINLLDITERELSMDVAELTGLSESVSHGGSNGCLFACEDHLADSLSGALGDHLL
mmetsp:Transcript_95619/g.131494  ORF Transcript_95619/g.131494 Transcript_95619/m.131494 type:complete len:253 (-) Transcript_95619:7-765(-)